MSNLPSIAPRLRRAATTIAALVALAAAALSAGVAAPAQAQVNTEYPGTYSYYPWGDCHVMVGDVKWSPAYAVGGADVSCDHRRGSITTKVDLVRWDGARAVVVRTSGWTTGYGVFATSTLTSPPYRGGGFAWWYTTVTVNVDGSQHTFASPWAPFAPAA